MDRLRPPRTPLLSSIAAIALASLLAGCMPLRYVTQAAAGQERLNGRGTDIAEIVEQGYLDRHTRDLLAEVPRIKAFGERHGLARTKNYERYLYVGHEAVVWVVSACHPLRFRPKTWSFPVVGSITYTGWFDRAEAASYARDLRQQGWDVDVRPSGAYSTLGWFDDPVLSTMISREEGALGDLADVILHETLHATYYLPGQSTLNESVASFVGDTLALRYLDERLGPSSAEAAAFLAGRARGAARGKMMKAAHAELAALYDSPLPREVKLAKKAEIIDRLREETGTRRRLNNASLIQYKTYGSGRDEMEALLASCGGDMKRLLGALESLRAQVALARPHGDPATLLAPLLASGCPDRSVADARRPPADGRTAELVTP